MIQVSDNTIQIKFRGVNYSVSEAAVKEMREWASDCSWSEDDYYDDDWMDEMSDIQIIKSVNRFYDGGLPAFLRSLDN